jgi:mannonate dehydratase
MRETWRWFGPQDIVRTDDIVMAGAAGVVSALHHLPPGVEWGSEDIAARQAEIGRLSTGASSSLTWDVVESLPVSEAIKQQCGTWRDHVGAWGRSLTALAQADIRLVCYNFMPVLDWTRTDLAWPLHGGGTCMRFDDVDFAVFDLHILGRPGATDDTPEALRDAAARRFAGMDDDARVRLTRNIIAGLPGGHDRLTLDGVRVHLSAYDGIDAARLRANLVDFLSEVTPLAERLGLRLCCHPDDPPWPLLGLPRVMSTEGDYRAVLDAVDLPANGVTFCTGSFGARADNDLPGMFARLASRVHFIHLRNVRREGDAPGGAFHEAEHLGGSTDMVAVIAAALAEEARRRAVGRADAQIPMRPDHGQDITYDLTAGRTQPGYPLVGRLKGLAELRGVAAALSHPVARGG